MSVRRPGPGASEDDVLDWQHEVHQSRLDEDRADREQACVECGVMDEWNFAVQHADGAVSWVCQEHGQDGLEGDEAV